MERMTMEEAGVFIHPVPWRHVKMVPGGRGPGGRWPQAMGQVPTRDARSP